MTVRYVQVDGKDYTVHLAANGQPERVEVGSYSFKGRLVLRAVKRDGAAWKRAIATLNKPAAA